MGRMYTVEFEGVAVTAVQDFFELLPADDKPIVLHAVYLSQSSDVADAAEEMLRVRIKRFGATVTGGSGGAAPTPAPLESILAAAGFTAETNNTTQATTSGTTSLLHSEAFNIRVGFQWIPTPEMRPIAKQTEALLVSLIAAPADSLTMQGTAYVEEL